MRMTSITYRKTFNLGSYQSEAIGVEMELNEGESAVTALDNCAALVNEYHAKTLAELEEFRGVQEKIIQETAVDQTIKGLIQDINDCASIDIVNPLGVQVGLLAYEETAKSHPDLQEAYDLKLISLQNQ